MTGQTGSGGSETQNFCYDEQNRLLWAGNSGTQPAPGNGTCGTGTLSSRLTGGSYSNSFVYTHLGQLWKGPLNGSGNYKYLYCTTGSPHQLTGLFPTGSGASCTNQTGAVYTSSYDNWGNVNARAITNGASAILSYDKLYHFVEWTASNPTTQEWYAYDASGTRVLRRSTSGGATTLTVYAFGVEEHTYSSSGTLQGNTYYYSLAGQLIGELTGQPATKTNIFLTDGLGSVLATFSNTAGSAALLGNQVYGPYGSQRYQQGTMGTNKGFTGQYNDAVTGLDYYNSRYYDPVAGVFLSADKAQGNVEGMNPYDYVGGNPETHNDPTGQFIPTPGGGAYYPKPPPVTSTPEPPPVTLTGNQGRLCQMNGGCGQLSNSPTNNRTALLLLCSVDLACKHAEFDQNLQESLQFFAGVLVVGFTAVELTGLGLNILGYYALTHPEEDQALLDDLAPTSEEMTATIEQENEALAQQLEADGICSFTPATRVATAHGEQPIGKLQVGEKVWAYNPQTHKMELQPILHVWIHPDNDLIDLKISTIIASHQGKAAKHTDEVVHTTSKHPFFTVEHGFLPAGKIRVGMHVLRANGRVGVITGWKVVPGTKVMYNLEVAHDHTFTVGEGQWVVHNCSITPPDLAAGWATRDPNAPAPQSVLDKAAETGQAQNSLFNGKGKNIPTVGSVVITDPTGNYLWSTGSVIIGTGAQGGITHAENQGISLAYEWLSENAEMGGDYAVHIITENQPCARFCRTPIFSGAWAGELQEAASYRGANAGLFVWHHLNKTA